MTLDEIVLRIRKDHPETIRAETDALIDIALKKIANDNCNLKPGSSDSRQLDLFAEYGVSQTVNVVRPDKNGELQSVRLRLDALTVAQAEEYIESHTPQQKPSKRIIEFERLVKDVRPYGSSGSTIAECWAASRVAKEAGARR